MRRAARFLLTVSSLGVAATAALGAEGDGELRKLDFGGGRPALYQKPSNQKAKRPLVVFLHGMCALPEWECPVFRGATSAAWLLCPPGPAACGGGGAMWVGTTRALTGRVDRASDKLGEQEDIDLAKRALVGYSLGGPAALRIALDQPGRYQRLMFVNTSVAPSRAQLERGKISRVALVAGEADGTAAKLKSLATRLARVGVHARYFGLKKTGHYFDSQSEERMHEPLEWLTSDW